LTTGGDVGSLSAAVDEGRVSALLAKPYTVDALIDTIETLLGSPASPTRSH